MKPYIEYIEEGKQWIIQIADQITDDPQKAEENDNIYLVRNLDDVVCAYAYEMERFDKYDNPLDFESDYGYRFNEYGYDSLEWFLHRNGIAVLNM